MCWSICCGWNSFTTLQDKHRAASGQIYGPLLLSDRYEKRNHFFGMLIVSGKPLNRPPGTYFQVEKENLQFREKRARNCKIGDFKTSYFLPNHYNGASQQWLNWLIFLTLLIHSCGVSWLDKLIVVSPFDENSENSCFAARSHDTHCCCYEA